MWSGRHRLLISFLALLFPLYGRVACVALASLAGGVGWLVGMHLGISNNTFAALDKLVRGLLFVSVSLY